MCTFYFSYLPTVPFYKYYSIIKFITRQNAPHHTTHARTYTQQLLVSCHLLSVVLLQYVQGIWLAETSIYVHSGAPSTLFTHVTGLAVISLCDQGHDHCAHQDQRKGLPRPTNALELECESDTFSPKRRASSIYSRWSNGITL